MPAVGTPFRARRRQNRRERRQGVTLPLRQSSISRLKLVDPLPGMAGLLCSSRIANLPDGL